MYTYSFRLWIHLFKCPLPNNSLTSGKLLMLWPLPFFIITYLLYTWIPLQTLLSGLFSSSSIFNFFLPPLYSTKKEAQQLWLDPLIYLFYIPVFTGLNLPEKNYSFDDWIYFNVMSTTSKTNIKLTWNPITLSEFVGSSTH